MPNPETNARATCDICKRPMAMAKHEVRGRPMHGQCWLDELRQRWMRERSPRLKAILAETGRRVAETLS
jgi:hypothetical protein